MADILGEIHEVRKGIWAFFIGAPFRMLSGLTGKLRSRGRYPRAGNRRTLIKMGTSSSLWAKKSNYTGLALVNLCVVFFQ